jgi:hypothetical protein
MITIRDALLDLLFGTRKKGAFNSTTNRCTPEIDVSAFVADTILALKKEAVIADAGVDYAKIEDSEAFTRLRSVLYPCLADFDPALLDSLAEKKAFWINLYHLLTLDAVLQQSIQRSVTEGWLGIVRFFRTSAYIVGGMRFSLEDIEHGILRANRGLMFIPGKQFGKSDPRYAHCLDQLDARIHFALNCASRSCPPIAYYSAERLDAQLDLSAAHFIDSETEMDKSGVALHISRIFKWYQKDFGGKYGVLEWIHRYLPEKDMRRILIGHFNDKTMTIYKRYDWRLNEVSESEA